MRGNTARNARLRSRAALLAGAAAAGLLAWGWLRPADGSVPGWEPVNAQVAAAVANAEVEGGKAERAGGKTGSADASSASAATVRPADTKGAAEPTAGGSAPVLPPASSSASPASNALEEAQSPAAESADGRLDINRASAAELDALPGIGPAKAEAIVQYRKAHGRFGSPEALTDVKGIGDKLLAKLLPLIKAG
ncbi:helix-hairpin-helix domain-containing protein [Cohnella sp. GbtcB17]|uniref:ComEA family DNA-binding protein n=1 Tax=Cohnella sp. GbtcB17 TaxID=2824762 RepID=UPI0027D2CA9D|nr:helix-hairpin-helix domain-containing protein [Cohnella sp. GbtcB17]